MPFAENNGVRIYYEVTGSEGPPLVLQHGLTQSIESWKSVGYVEKLASEFQLILIDGRGHGRSDKPHDPEDYRLSTCALDVTAVMDELDIDRTHYWGFSMGAGIGFALMWQAPERINSIVLGAGSADRSTSVNPIVDAVLGGREAFLELIENAFAAAGKQVPEVRRKEIVNLDFVALAAAVNRPSESEHLVEALKRYDRSALAYAGELDGVYQSMVRATNDNPKIEFFSLANLDHIGCWNAPDAVVPTVLKFLRNQG